jgi:hypothetical protein
MTREADECEAMIAASSDTFVPFHKLAVAGSQAHQPTDKTQAAYRTRGIDPKARSGGLAPWQLLS